ncbi:MAG: hypothetical protein AAFX93_15785 [Verrucomicrobiota bacterium]
MPTNPLGAGTRNRTTNLPKPLDSVVSRLAFESDMSVSAYLRQLAKEAAEQGRIIVNEDKRQLALGISCALLLGIGFGSTISISVMGQNEPRAAQVQRTKGRRRDESIFDLENELVA